MACNCKSWKENNEKLTSVFTVAKIHGIVYNGERFTYCGWCGEKLFADPNKLSDIMGTWEDLPDLSVVIGKILTEIPDAEGYRHLRRLLMDARDSLLYAAPETVSGWWHRVAGYLNVSLPGPGDEDYADWAKNVATLISGKEID